MMIHLLVTENMLPVGPGVTVNENYGKVFLVVPAGTSIACEGDHCVVSGTVEAIQNWLRPFDGFWLGKGPVQLQEFVVSHAGNHGPCW
jgi:hypothetical protein